MSGEWTTPKEVCTELKISRPTLWEWRRRQEDPFPAGVAFSANVLRFRVADVQAWIARRGR
jgi:predicted DNA-binding transcriptional regulator AlpA